MLFPKYCKTLGAAGVIKQEVLTFDLEVARGGVPVGLAGDLARVLQVRVLDDQLPLLPLHHDLYSPVLPPQDLRNSVLALFTPQSIMN